jgi:DNA-binding CsgD family transcriptional regulator
MMISTSVRKAHDESSSCAMEKTERDVALGIIERLADQAAEPGSESISQEMRRLIQHDFFACGLVRVYDARIVRVINTNFPDEFLDALQLHTSSVSCVPVQQWLVTRKPLLVQSVDTLLPLERIAALLSWPVPRGGLALHGQLDSTGTRGLIFLFGNVPLLSREKCEHTLRFLTPYLFFAMARTFWSVPKTVDVRPLTAREIEVTEWMHCGKTNEEIAELLNISVYTVKNHVQKILLKLSASNRTQAVLRAVEVGIVRDHESARRPRI